MAYNNNGMAGFCFFSLVAVIERKQEKERAKIAKQQEKLRQQEQLRIEREMRAQQIIEVPFSFFLHVTCTRLVVLAVLFSNFCSDYRLTSLFYFCGFCFSLCVFVCVCGQERKFYGSLSCEIHSFITSSKESKIDQKKKDQQ